MCGPPPTGEWVTGRGHGGPVKNLAATHDSSRGGPVHGAGALSLQYLYHTQSQERKSRPSAPQFYSVYLS